MEGGIHWFSSFVERLLSNEEVLYPPILLAIMLRESSKRRCLFFGLLALILYLFVVPSKYTVKFDGELRTTRPSVVWEFLADFNNIKKLNPTIVNFTITFDNGNYEHWVYDVKYSEFLYTFPSVYNHAKARYQVYHVPVSAIERDQYVVESLHETCFIGDRLCLNSWSKFICTPRENNVKGTYCLEEIVYECPRLMAGLCRREVMFQRQEIFKNLLTYFE